MALVSFNNRIIYHRDISLSLILLFLFLYIFSSGFHIILYSSQFRGLCILHKFLPQKNAVLKTFAFSTSLNLSHFRVPVKVVFCQVFLILVFKKFVKLQRVVHVFPLSATKFTYFVN